MIVCVSFFFSLLSYNKNIIKKHRQFLYQMELEIFHFNIEGTKTHFTINGENLINLLEMYVSPRNMF